MLHVESCSCVGGKGEMTDKKVIKARKLFRRKWREAITTPDYISVLNEDGRAGPAVDAYPCD